MKTRFSPRRVVATAALVIAVAAATPVEGQAPAEVLPQRTKGWAFTPGVTFGTVYDSNVALASAPASTQTTQADQLWLVQPFGELGFNSSRTDFTGGYHGFLRRYTDVTQLNGFDQNAYLTFRRIATKRVQFFAHDNYAKVPTTDEMQLNGVPFMRTGSRTNTLSAGTTVRLTKFTDVTGRYDMTWVNFDRTQSLLTGGWVHAFRTELTHRINERTTLGAAYGLRLADLNQGTRQVTFQDAGVLLQYAVGPATTVELSGGVSHLSDKLLNDTRTGPYVRAALTHDVQRAAVGVSYERSFVPSFGFGGSTQNQELGGFVRSPLGHTRFYVQGSAAWRRSEPFIANELRLDTIWIRSTIGYGVSRWLRTEGFYAFTRQDSRVTGGEINRQRLGIQAVIAQPMRLR